MSFPTSLDVLTTGIGANNDKLSSPNHVTQHTAESTAIQSLEAKVGIDGSAVTTSHDYKLSEVTSTDKSVGKTATQTLTNKTLTSPTITGATITTSTLNGVTLQTAGSATDFLAANGTYQTGAVANGSTTVKGIFEAATSAEINAGTATGGTGAVLVVTPDQFVLSKFSTRFGGTGVDGVLNVTSGTTTLDLTSSAYKVFNYSSINVSAGATLTFSNPNSGGTVIILKSQGNVTIAGTVNAKGFGVPGGVGGAVTTSGTAGANITSATIFASNATGGGGGGTYGAGGGTGGSALTNTLSYTLTQYRVDTKSGIYLVPGGGGGGGAGGNAGGAGGNGGAGGAGLYIECSGALNFTGSIDISGANGSSGVGTASGGGGGGAPGTLLVLYNMLTSNSGTITSTGGTGGAGGAGGGTTGGGGGGGSGYLGSGANGGSGGVGSNSTTGGGGGGSANGNAGGTGASTNSSSYLISLNTYF